MIGYGYLFVFLILPSIPVLQFFSPIIIILWPIVVTQIIVFYDSATKKPIQFFSIDSKIRSRLPQLIRIGFITFFYAFIISSILSSQMQSIVEQANSDSREIDVKIFFNIILKLFIFMLPLFAATWFAPMITVFKKEVIWKSLKSSIAAIVIYIIPLTMTWVSLLIGFAFAVYGVQTVLSLFGLSENILTILSTIIIFSLTSLYISALFIFQYLSYKEIFKL
jgi:hypothetical protein